MIEWQQRVVEEHQELHDKVTKLTKFMASNNGLFESLEKEDKKLLVAQASVMWDYIDILEERIERFKDV